MRIGNVDLDRRVLLIAEIGNNHEGDFNLAVAMIEAAAAAGADAVKFQTIVPELLVAPSETARIAQLKRYAFTPDQFAQLAEAARKANVLFLSTPFDIGSVAALAPLVPAFKIASGDNDWLTLHRAVARTGKPILMSTGLASLDEVARAKSGIDEEWAKLGTSPGLVVLHCVSAYPTAPEDTNLAALQTLAKLGVVVGYSDHTLGIDAAFLSVALGARVIEKHFTLDHDQSDFRDHKLSADPREFAELVKRVRLAEAMVGTGGKGRLDVEAAVAAAARRSVHVVRDLAAGTVLSEADIIALRPAGGIAAADMDSLIGRRLTRAVLAGARLATTDLA